MCIYTNLTNFMKHEGFSYSDRVVLDILIRSIKAGYNIKIFVKNNDRYLLVNEQMIMEYFFTKTIKNKKKYMTELLFSFSEINEEDSYFEVDILYELDEEWSQYYIALNETNCNMYSYIYFDLNTSADENKKYNSWLEFHQKYISQIYFSSYELQEAFLKTWCFEGECSVLTLEKFVNCNYSDEILEIDKGLNRIIKEQKYVVFLPEEKKHQLVVSNMNKILRENPLYTILVFEPPIFINTKTERYFEKMKEFGNSIFLLRDIDYYTMLNLYVNAHSVFLSEKTSVCNYEKLYLKHCGAHVQFI